MRIRHLQLTRYGKFTDQALDLPAQGSDLHLIVGPNEAGKSTLRTALGDWLFGIPVRTTMGFLHPMPTLHLSGTLERRHSGETLSFARIKAQKNTLRALDGTVLPDHVLQPWLGGLTLEGFVRMYALDHTALVQGSAGILSASDDVGRLLFQSAAGMERLGAVQTALEQAAESEWGPKKSAARSYYQAQDAYHQALSDFKAHSLRSKDWKERHHALSATQTQLAEARARDTALRQQLSRLERLRRTAPLLLALDTARQEWAQLQAQGAIALLDAQAAETLRSAHQRLALVQADLARLAHEAAQARSQCDAVQVDTALLAQARDIAELDERRVQYRAHPGDMVRRSQEVQQHWQRVQALAAGLGWGEPSEDALRQRLPAPVLRQRLARLLKQHAEHTAQQRSAEQQQQECAQHLALARDKLAALGTGSLPAGLAAALEQAQPLGTHATTLRELVQQGQIREAHIQAALQPLAPWCTGVAALASMLVPDLAHLQALQEQQRQDTLQHAALQENLERKTQDIETLQLQLQQLVRTHQPISHEQVQQARQQRDHLWQHLKATPAQLPAQASAFEHQVQQADQLADTRLERAQHDAQRQAQMQRLQQHELERQHLLVRQHTLAARLQERRAQWQAQAQACQLPPVPLEHASAWCQQRQQVLALVQEHTALLCQQRSLEEAVHRARQTLWTLLEPAPAVAGTPPPLSDCLRLAQERLQAVHQIQGQRQALQQHIHDAQARLAPLQQALGAAQAASAAWQVQWQHALHEAGYSATTTTLQVETELDSLQEMEHLLHTMHSIRTQRIDTMQADLDWFAHSARSLAQRLAPELQTRSAPEIALELGQRLHAAEQAHAAQRQAQARWEQAHSDTAQAQRQQEAVHADLAPLYAAAGVRVGDLHALAQAIARSDQHRHLQATLAHTQHALQQAGDGLGEAALRAEAAGVDPDSAQAERLGLTEQAQVVVQEIAELSRRDGEQKTALDAFSGSDSAAQAEARRQEAIAAMSESAQRYLQWRTAARLLQWSLEKYRSTQQGPMLACASQFFQTLTGSAFTRLLVDNEGSTPHLLGQRAGGQAVPISAMSEGTRDQLYLALRLAALQLQAQEGQSLPLVADDLFINFDDQRTCAGLQVLATLARSMQVIVLTHHEHLAALAQQTLGPSLPIVRW